MKKGSVYYITRPEWPNRDGTLPQASYFLEIDYILLGHYYNNTSLFRNTSPVRFEQLDLNTLKMRLDMSHLWECIPYCSWDDVVSFYCKAFQGSEREPGAWFQMEPSLRERHWWKRYRSRVRVEYNRPTTNYNNGKFGRSERIEELEVWTPMPGIEQTWYTTAMFEAELAERLSTNRVSSNLQYFLTSEQLRDEMGTQSWQVQSADYELEKVTKEIATEVAQETQKIEAELALLDRIEATKPDYDAFIAEFEEQMRQIMEELATPAGRVEEDSGIQEIVMGHGIQLSSAEMEARISNRLVSLPMSRFEKFARVKIAENIPQNPGKKCVSCGLLNDPGVLDCVQCQTRIIGANEYIIKTIKPPDVNTQLLEHRIKRILANNIHDKYLRERTTVEAEIAQRQTSCSGSTLAQPLPQHHARTVPVQGHCPNCGKNNPSSSRFCNQCGTKLH